MRMGQASDTPQQMVSDADRRFLLDVARQAIREFLEKGIVTIPETRSTTLLAHAAAFVTLHDSESHALRGCLGEVLPQRPLIQSVVEMARAAATSDPRFDPVPLEELAGLSIEISAMTPLVPIHPDQIEVGRHGLILTQGRRRGLLLPHVAVQQGWERRQFLEGVCHKAGLPADAWESQDSLLQAFQTETFSDDDF